MEDEDKVPLILERPFLHTADAIIRVKNKELNLGVGDDRITFLIDKAMQHSFSNDDTCFRVDVINEVIEEELDALLDDSKPFSNTKEESLLPVVISVLLKDDKKKRLVSILKKQKEVFA
nr:reverse transcriptase domain-containing protein [Tanacetum cinerariifolium]